MDLLSKNHLNPEFEPKSQHEFEFEDDFPMEVKGVFQDLHQLDSISLVGSSFEPDYATHVTGYDPFGPLPFGVSSNDLDLYEFKPLEPVNDGGMVVSLNNQYKSFVGWGGANFSTCLGIVECPIQDPKPMSFFVPDEGSCVTARGRMNSNRTNPNHTLTTVKPSSSASINGGGEEVDSYLMMSASCSSGLQGEVKKEMDLMEMISQVNL